MKLSDVFDASLFVRVPDSWHVIIADVKNSTASINAGNHNDVNLVAATSLIIPLNIARDNGVEIPFFFTGDGGTVIVPEPIRLKVLEALKKHNYNTIKNFNLALHYGSVQVSDIIEAGHAIEIAKLDNEKGFPKPIVIGSGLHYAESVIKKLDRDDDDEGLDYPVNIEGLECRWDRVRPPTLDNEVVCYLIEATRAEDQLEVYSQVLQKMDQLYGEPDKRNPLALHRLKLMLSLNKIRKEMIARFGRWKSGFLIFEFLKTFIGQLIFRFNWKIGKVKGIDYLRQVISNADTLTIDGRISTIVSGTTEKRLQFIKYLEEEELDERLIFGHYINKASIMTCYIEHRDDRHIHFVDGADGGYTAASQELKQKLLRR